MIHATFADNTTMLFEPSEPVVVCDEIYGGEYIVNDRSGLAHALIVPGVHVLERAEDEDGGDRTKIASSAKIVSIREV